MQVNIIDFENRRDTVLKAMYELAGMRKIS